MRKTLTGVQLSAVQIILVIQLLRIQSVDFRGIICVVIDGWNVLDHIWDPKQVKYLLGRLSIQLSESFVQNLFLEKNPLGWNLLHKISGRGDWELLQHFLDLSEEFNNKCFLRSLLNSRTSDGSNFLHILVENCQVDITLLHILLDWVQHNLDKVTLIEFMQSKTTQENNVILVCSRYQPVKILIEIIELLTTKFEHDEVKTWLQARDHKGNNFALIVTKYNNPCHIDLLLTSCVRRFLDILFLEDILFGCDENDATVLHILAVKNPDAFFDVIQIKSFDFYFTEKAFMMNGPNGKRIFDLIVHDGPTLKNTIAILSKKFDRKLVGKYLLLEDNEDNSFLIQALKDKDLPVMFELFDWLRENIKAEFFKKLMEHTKQSHFLFAHSNDPASSLQVVLTKVSKRIPKTSCNRAANAKRISILLEMYCRCNEKLKLYDLFTWLCTQFNDTQMRELLKVHDENDLCFLHFLKWMTQDFKNNFVKFILIATQTDNNAILHYISQENEDFFEILKWLAQEFSKDLLKDLLMAKNSINQTFLHSLCRFNNKINFMSLFKWLFQEVADKTFMEDLFLVRDSDGNTFIQVWSEVHNNNMLPVLKWMAKKFDKTFIKKLLIIDGHLLCLHGSEVESKLMSEWLREQFVNDIKEEFKIVRQKRRFSYTHEFSFLSTS